jgi:hypothetical protein
MTDLSPKAQEIIDAVDEVFSNGGRIRDGFASALRVLADNVAPDDYRCFYGDKEYDAGMEGRNDEIREAILSIATELGAL